MKARLLLASLLLVTGTALAVQSPPPLAKAIRVDRLDRLELQVAYDQVVKAEQQLTIAQQQVTIARQAFDKRFGEAQAKYKAPTDWGYNTATGQFEAPTPPKESKP